MRTLGSDVAARLRRARKHGGALVADGLFSTASHLGKYTPRARRALREAKVERDLAYRDTGLKEHTLDVWKPEGPGPWPVVLYVHGGGFRILSKDSHWLMAERFARQGFLVFNINYRLAPRFPYPAALEDACAAWAWAAANAARFGGDPERLVLAGESAGGNLVTALAVAASYPRPEPCARSVFGARVRPAAVVAACGMLQVSDPHRFLRRRRLPGWLFDRLEEVGDAYLGTAVSHPEGGTELADPLLLLERAAPARPLPPIFAFAGTRDPLLDDTRRLAGALRRHGSPHRVRYYPGELHAFHALSWRAQARRCWSELFDFLDEHLRPAAAGRLEERPGPR